MTYSVSLAFGLILFAMGLYLLTDRIALIKNGTITRAVVSKVLEEKGNDGGVSYRAVFSFTTKQHDTINYKDNYSSDNKNWREGNAVNIVYKNDAPYDVAVLTFNNAFALSTCLLATGAGLLVFGGGSYRAQKFFKKLRET